MKKINALTRQEMDFYLQELLSLQYKLTQCFDHQVTKGTLREKFIKQVVKSELPTLRVRNGIIIDEGNWQSSQIDFIKVAEGSREGNFETSDLCDCKVVMEIKSKAINSELTALNTLGEDVKSRSNGHVLIGMFCYSTKALGKTVLEKFGFPYDKDLLATLAYEEDKDELQHIDFIFSLDLDREISSPFFVFRSHEDKRNGVRVLHREGAVITPFFLMLKTN